MLLNKARAIQMMRKFGFDGLVASNPENVTYASDYGNVLMQHQKDWQVFVVLPQDIDNAALIVPRPETRYLSVRPTWIKDIRNFGTYFVEGPDAGAPLSDHEQILMRHLREGRHVKNGFEALIEVLADKGLANGRLGVDEKKIPAEMQARIKERLPGITLAPAFALFREIRMVKTPDELERLRACSAVNEAGVRKLIDAIAHGASEKEFVDAYRVEVSRQGALPFLCRGAIGTGSCAGFPPTDRRPRSGDIMCIDAGCILNSYYSDTARTVVVGEPSAKLKQYYAAVREASEVVRAAVKPGMMASELFTMEMEVVKRVMPHYKRHLTGHSIGLELYELPLLTPPGTISDIFLGGEVDRQLEENMVLNIEVPYYELGFGGLQLEDTIVLNKSGYEFITTLDRDLLCA